MAAVNLYRHTNTTSTFNGVTGLAAINLNQTGTYTCTISDGGSTTIAVINVNSAAGPPLSIPLNCSLVSTSVVVTLSSSADITLLTW